MHLERQGPMEYRAGLYIRLSKEDDSQGPSESVENQRSLLEEFVKDKGLKVHDVYTDDGWSGTDFVDVTLRKRQRA